jgi:hypothetical protein
VAETVVDTGSVVDAYTEWALAVELVGLAEQWLMLRIR